MTRENPQMSCAENELYAKALKTNNFFISLGSYKLVYFALRIDFFINGNDFPSKIDFSNWVLSQGRLKSDKKEIQAGYSKHRLILNFRDFDFNDGKTNCRIIDFPEILGNNDQGLIESVQPYIGENLLDIIRRRGINGFGPCKITPRQVKGSECVKMLFNVASVVQNNFHVNRFVHRDLRTSNILVQLSPNLTLMPYITDFDLCSKISYTELFNGWCFDPALKKGYVLPFADIYILYINLISVYFLKIEEGLQTRKLTNESDFKKYFQSSIEDVLKSARATIDVHLKNSIKNRIEGNFQEILGLPPDVKKRFELLIRLARKFLEVFRQANELANEFKGERLQHPIFSFQYDKIMKELQEKYPALSIDAFKKACQDIYTQDTGEALD